MTVNTVLASALVYAVLVSHSKSESKGNLNKFKNIKRLKESTPISSNRSITGYIENILRLRPNYTCTWRHMVKVFLLSTDFYRWFLLARAYRLYRLSCICTMPSCYSTCLYKCVSFCFSFHIIVVILLFRGSVEHLVCNLLYFNKQLDM